MKAVFFYRADNATFTIDYPRIPRGLIKNGQRPYKVRFIGEDTNNRNILNWMKPELYYLISLAAAKEKLSMNQFVIDLLKRTCEKDDS